MQIWRLVVIARARSRLEPGSYSPTPPRFPSCCSSASFPMSLQSSLKLRPLSQLAELQKSEPITHALRPTTNPAGVPPAPDTSPLLPANGTVFRDGKAAPTLACDQWDCPPQLGSAGEAGPLLAHAQLSAQTFGPARGPQGIPARPAAPSSASSGRWLDLGCPPWCPTGFAERCREPGLRVSTLRWRTRLPPRGRSKRPQAPPVRPAPRPAPEGGPPPDWPLGRQAGWDWKPNMGGSRGARR